MDIVHVDPGYGRLMESNNALEYVENTTYNPYSGVAFTTAGSSGARAHFPNLDFDFTPTAQIYKKVWSVKLSIYSDGTGILHVGFTRAASSTDPDVGVDINSNSCSIKRYVDDSAAYEFNFIKGFSAGFHNISITLALTVEGTTYTRTNTIDVDNVVDYQTYTTTTAPAIPRYIVLGFGGGKHYYISNILVGQASYEGDGTGDIPSDDGIPANTPIYRLPLGTPATNFTAGTDEYIATANGQTLLSATNADDLIETHGNQPVNHIVVYGAPGYRVGSNVTSATGISKSGDAITSHGNITLDFDKTMHIYDVWEIAEGNTFNSIKDLQVGWRAGE